MKKTLIKKVQNFQNKTIIVTLSGLFAIIILLAVSNINHITPLLKVCFSTSITIFLGGCVTLTYIEVYKIIKNLI